MKTRINKKSYFLLAILTIFVFSSFMALGKASSHDFTFNIDEFKETIQNSPDDAWKKPAQNRKDTICNKLTELQQLIGEENFEKAYNKLLNDIKPKLTGLKQDEHGITWGNGVFKKPWVTCSDLRAMFLIECDLILDQINPFSVYDDDKTPPIISSPEDIEYEFGSTGNTLVWVVSDEYPNTYEIFMDGESFESGAWESGVSITINIDGFAVGTYEFMIKCDDSYNNIATDNVLVNVIEDDDTSPPTIVIYYLGAGTVNNAGIWIVVVEDLESGIDEIQCFRDGTLVLHEFLNGELLIDRDINVPSTVGVHTIEVIVTNYDKDWENDQETSTKTRSDEIDPFIPPPPPIIPPDTSPPIISCIYIGTSSQNEPGYWHIVGEDQESGIDQVLFIKDGVEEIVFFNGENLVVLDIPVPIAVGTHTIEVTVTNGDGLSETINIETYIEPYVPPPPPIIIG